MDFPALVGQKEQGQGHTHQPQIEEHSHLTLEQMVEWKNPQAEEERTVL